MDPVVIVNDEEEGRLRSVMMRARKVLAEGW